MVANARWALAITSKSSGVSLIKGVSSLTSSFGAGNKVSDAWMDDMMGEIRSHSHTGLAYYGPQEDLTMGGGEGDPVKPRNQATWNQFTFGLYPNPPSWVASTFNVLDGFSAALTDSYLEIKYSLSWDGIKSNALVGLNILASEKTYGFIPNYVARQTASNFYDFMADIPNYSIEDWQFGIGYGFEKSCEMLLTRRIGIGVSGQISSKINTFNLPKLGGTKDVGIGNPFNNATLNQVDDAFQVHVRSGKLQLKYVNQKTGGKAYQNTKSGYSYYLDPGGMYGKKLELPHIDVNYPNPKPLNVSPKKKLPTAGGY